NVHDQPNNLEVNWGLPGSKQRFQLQSLTFALCVDDPAIGPAHSAAGFDTYIGAGTGLYNGVPGATAAWIFTDAGEPGINDTANLVIRDPAGNVVLDVSGKLVFGNQQAHAQ